jgi:hypothetical protein
MLPVKEVPLAVRARLCYMQIGAQAHCSCAVRDVLGNTYHDRLIGRGGPTAWTPCSPNMNPLEKCPCGLLKPLVYAAPLHNEAALRHRILDACQTIRNYPGVFERMRRSTMRRVEMCIDFHGDNLSTYYKCTLSAITHKLNVFRRVLIWTVFLFWYMYVYVSCTQIFPQASVIACKYARMLNQPSHKSVIKTYSCLLFLFHCMFRLCDHHQVQTQIDYAEPYIDWLKKVKLSLCLTN